MGDWHGACTDVTRTGGVTLSVVMSTKETPARVGTDKKWDGGMYACSINHAKQTYFLERCVTRAIQASFHGTVSQLCAAPDV